MTSRIPGFYRLAPEQRLHALGRATEMGEADLEVYRSGGLQLSAADVMVENVISTFRLPNAVGCNFLINGRDRLVPMAVEEPSVVAAVSNMARLVRRSGGFTVDVDDSLMIGQVQIPNVSDPEKTVAMLTAALPQLEAMARKVHPRLVERGGGIRRLEVHRRTYSEPGHPTEEMVVLHVLLDCVDAMGANMVNTVCEHLAPHVEAATTLPVGLRILSNLADQRLARATCALDVDTLTADDMPGEQLADLIASAWRFAWADPYRAATHNKGVMNGIDAVAIATGNDWRAIEAGAHAFCARDGQYRPMTRWTVSGKKLIGSLEIPMQVGTVGGPIRVHPTVQANLRLLECTGAKDLAGVMAAVGLSQNLGALRALAGEGIQAGHMRMHARTVAATAGAEGDEVLRVTAILCEEREFSVERAKQVLAELRS
ncbi:MAG: hydroxymethylglutaryl-CoA reductase, degradative [Myxococcota bacterium]